MAENVNYQLYGSNLYWVHIFFIKNKKNSYWY